MKCDKCTKPSKDCKEILTNGPRGYRRYKLCPNCVPGAIVKAKKLAKATK